MRRSTTVVATCGILAICAAFVASTGAQEPTPDEPLESFGERVEVQVVEVEVRVTDRKGRPVTGLSRDQFQLLEDGRPVDIGYFAEYQDLQAQRASGTPAREPAAAAPSEPAPPPRPPLPDVAHLVIFLDQLHLEPGGRGRVLEGLQTFVIGLPASVPVMVVSAARKVEVVQGFTADRSALAQALAGQEETTAGGIFQAAAYRGTRRQIEQIYHQYENVPGCSSPCECGFGEMEAAVRDYGGQVANDVEQTLGGLASVSAALSGVPGRKVVLMVSDGLEARPGLDLFHYIADLCPQFEQEVSRNYTSEDLLGPIQDVTSDAAANRVTIYSLEAAGLRGDAADMSIGSRQFRPSTMTQRMRTANLQQSLYVLADETGGEATLNANRFGDSLAAVAQDVGTYYSLGFTSDHAGDGQAHTIRVEVDAPHHDLRYRKAYSAKPIETRIAEGAVASLVFGYEANPLNVSVEIGEPVPVAGKGSSVPVSIRVPLSSLALDPGSSGEIGRVRLMLTAIDGRGHWTPIRQKLVGIKAAAEEDRATAVRTFEVEMELPAGEHVLAVGVRDELGGEVSFVRQTFQVASRR
jgi:VWFA-related protein